MWCLTAIGGVGKHIMNREHSTNGNVRMPGAIVAARDITSVTTVDKAEGKWQIPCRTNHV